MSSFLCFICHNTVYDDTSGETREKYRELIGMKLCPDSHLCHICCHMLSKLWLFKSICLRRSMEYPILFSDKGTISLQTNNTELIIMCPATDECDPYHAAQRDPDHNTSSNHYVALEDRTNINMYELTDDVQKTNDIECDYGDNLFNDDYEINEIIQTEVENCGSPIHDDKDVNEKLINLDKNDKSDVNKELINLDKNHEKTEINEELTNLDKKIEFHKVILSIEEQRAELEAKRREDRYLEAEFKCYNCALGFLFKDTYQAHMMRHEESNGEHLCDICTLRFASAAVLRAHQCSHRERVTCLWCGRPVPSRRTAAHRARCGTRSTRAPCHLCGKTFPDANGLQQHIKRFHLAKTSSKSYSCSVCGKRCSTQAAVRTHMIKHINKKFPCPLCPAALGSPYALAQHRRAHAGAGPGCAAHGCAAHGCTAHGCTAHGCTAHGCTAHGCTAHGCTAHGCTAHAGAGHGCAACGRHYRSRKSLLAHLRNSLTHQQTVFACPICARPCPHRRALASHMQTVHAAVKQHACSLCPARYTSRKSLAAHMRGHEGRGAPLAVCHLCGASFKGNSKLNRHLRSVCEKGKLEEELAALYNQE